MGEIGLGLIGTGFMGRAHALAFAAAPTIFGTKLRAVPRLLADVNLEFSAARGGVAGLRALDRRLARAGP